MSAATKGGGPAFPLQSIGPDFPPGHAGMTLRDYFAGQALASSDWAAWEDRHGKEALIAHRCYEIADVMLAKRKGGSK